VRLGAGCGRPLADDERGALDDYSAAIGLAFQVVDDILDASADSATLGKTAGKDAANDKPTYVSLLGLAAARDLAADLRASARSALAGFGTLGARLAAIADQIVLRRS
jgi:farnesyl diphosphate synthase